MVQILFIYKKRFVFFFCLCCVASFWLFSFKRKENKYFPITSIPILSMEKGDPMPTHTYWEIYKLHLCRIPKNAGTVLAYVFCYISDPPKFSHDFQSAQKWHSGIEQGDPLCARAYREREVSEKVDVFKITNINHFAVIRGPIERFVSAWLNLCNDGKEWCFECLDNINCFIEQNYATIHQISRDSFQLSNWNRYYHFYPQTWTCNFDQHLNQYNLLVHSKAQSVPVESMAYKRIDDSDYAYMVREEKWPKPMPEMKTDFYANGYIIIRNVLSDSEVGNVKDAMENWKQLWEHTFEITDTKKSRFGEASWNEPGEDIFGMLAGSAKTVNICEELLNRGELYMYNAKAIMKPAKTGGALLWHQDYGYWYNNRCIWPDFITCILAITKSYRENGGVQVLKSSHLCGRIKHSKEAGQTGADLERAAMIQKKLELVHVDLAAGDCVMFHGNTLHQSSTNTSEFKRWNLIFSYNTKNNSPDLVHYNAQYNPLKRWPADAVVQCCDIQIQQRSERVDPFKNLNVTLLSK